MSRGGEIKAAAIGTAFIGSARVEALHRLDIEVTGIGGSSPKRLVPGPKSCAWNACMAAIVKRSMTRR